MVKLKRKYKKRTVPQAYKFDGAYVHDWGTEYLYSHTLPEPSDLAALARNK